MKVPDAHQWQKVRRALWRCPWCGACRKGYKKPGPEDRNQPDAVKQYEALTGTPA